MPVFLQGLTMGLAYVAPIGTQNLFVINSALTHPRGTALRTALIVIFFDVSLALACFFGAGAVMERFPLLRTLVLLAGGAVVTSIGIGLLRTKDASLSGGRTAHTLAETVVSACVVTWFNPQAIIDGTLMLGAFRAALPDGQSALFMLGTACASFTWFTGITLLISLFSTRFNERTVRIINRICGCIILFYGLRLLCSFVRPLLGL